MWQSPLPPVLDLSVEYRTAEPQLLPPFLGSALHGVLGRTLRELACSHPKRPQCQGCPALASCGYTELFETPGLLGDAVRGVREQAPRPIAFAAKPLESRAAGEGHAVPTGTRIGFAVALIGTGPALRLGLLSEALRRAASFGFGTVETPSGEWRRGRLVPGVEIRAQQTPSLMPGSRLVENEGAQSPQATAQLHIETISPLRLKAGGRIVSTLAPLPLVTALARRANALSVIHGTGLACVDERLAIEAAREIKISNEQIRVRDVRRYSERQQQRMSWPGTEGRAVWRGGGIPALADLLTFGARVQVGKGTALGFGRFELRFTSAPGEAESEEGHRVSRSAV